MSINERFEQFWENLHREVAGADVLMVLRIGVVGAAEGDKMTR